MIESWHFGKCLHALRDERGLSLRQFAEKIGVKHPQIVRWENQSHAPKQRTLEQIAKGLNCPVADLLPPASNGKDTPHDSAFMMRIAELEGKLKEFRKEMDEQIEVFNELNELLKNHTENNNPVLAINGIRLRISEVVLKYEKNRLFGFFLNR